MNTAHCWLLEQKIPCLQILPTFFVLFLFWKSEKGNVITFCLSALFTKSSRHFEYQKYTGAYHPKIFLCTFFVLSWIVQYTLSTGSNLGQDYCVQQCTLETWLHPISFSKKAKSQKNLLIFYPLHYTWLICTLKIASAHFGISPPTKNV